MENKVYLVWEREYFDEYGVIMVTTDERKAQELSGQKKPSGGWSERESRDTDCWYGIRQFDTEYYIDGEEYK